IYLDRSLQNQVCNTFHYALKPGGYLFLGSSESIDVEVPFRVVSRDVRIFQARDDRRAPPPLPLLSRGPRVAPPFVHGGHERDKKGNYVGEHRQALEDLAPPSILVDEGHRILNLSENAGRYLLQPGGPISSLAADVVRPELILDVRAALHRVFEQNAATLTPALAVQFNGT